MARFARFFIENYRFTLVISVFVMIFGLTGLLSVNSESFPSVNIGAVVISTRYGGATAEDIETKITKPIEDEIQKVSGLKLVKSISQAGASTIITEVDIDRYSIEKVIANLQRAVDRASGLPTDLLSKPVFTEIKSEEFPVIELAVIGENTDRLRDRVADELQESIRDNKKVSSVLMDGFRKRQFNIYLDLQKMQANHVAIAEVQGALMQRNLTIPAGEIKGDIDQMLVRVDGKARTKDELEAIVIRSNFSGQKVRIADIARVEDFEEEPRTLALLDGRPAVLLTITKKGGADLIDLSAEISAVVDGFREKYRGQLDFEIFNNEGVRVGNRLSVLTANGWQGIALVLMLLLLFLPGRLGFVSALSLPLTLLATLGCFLVFDYTLNTLTIIALVIAIGMLVDNAVVVSENFTRLRDEGQTSSQAAMTTIRDLWAPITTTTLTTIAAFVPMLVTTGILGQFIKAIPIVVSIALGLSLIEAFFLLPTRLVLTGYRPRQSDGRERDGIDSGFIARRVQPVFKSQMRWLVRNRWKSFGIFVSILIAAIGLLAFGNRVNLFPADQTEIYLARLTAPQGTRIEATTRFAEKLDGLVRAALDKKYANVAIKVGSSAVDPGDPKGEIGSNTALMKIYVTNDTRNNVATSEVLAILRKIKIDEFAQVSFEPLINGPPVGAPVTVTFRSNNVASLDAVVQAVIADLSAEPGIFDTRVDDVIGDQEVAVRIDFDQAAKLGLTLQDIGTSIRTAVAGTKTGDINLDNRTVDYFLRFDSASTSSIDDLKQLKVSDRVGNLIPLANVASFEMLPGSPQIKRYDFKRSKTVTANIDDAVTTSILANAVVSKTFDRIKNQFKDVSIVFGGEAEKTKESFKSLVRALVLSLIGIFALLVLMFNSYLSPLIILSTIPLGLVGVSLAFFLHQRDISFLAFIGVIGLGGIIVNSGIILISFIEDLKKKAMKQVHHGASIDDKLSLVSGPALEEILVEASSLRLRAVLVTSLTTIGGLIPTAYGIGGKDTFIIPMALALAWGLSTGTLLTLYWIPPAYKLIDDMKVWFRKKSFFRKSEQSAVL